MKTNKQNIMITFVAVLSLFVISCTKKNSRNKINNFTPSNFEESTNENTNFNENTYNENADGQNVPFTEPIYSSHSHVGISDAGPDYHIELRWDVATHEEVSAVYQQRNVKAEDLGEAINKGIKVVEGALNGGANPAIDQGVQATEESLSQSAVAEENKKNLVQDMLENVAQPKAQDIPAAVEKLAQDSIASSEPASEPIIMGKVETSKTSDTEASTKAGTANTENTEEEVASFSDKVAKPENSEDSEDSEETFSQSNYRKSVSVKGILKVMQDNSSSCKIPLGTYNLSTVQAGGYNPFNYITRNLQLVAQNPETGDTLRLSVNSFFTRLVQNTQGQLKERANGFLNLYAHLTVTKVNGRDCEASYAVGYY